MVEAEEIERMIKTKTNGEKGIICSGLVNALKHRRSNTKVFHPQKFRNDFKGRDEAKSIRVDQKGMYDRDDFPMRER